MVIAGAGPAGVAAAVALAARIPAERILCLDKARFPRDKPCGGGLTGHAHAALARLGLEVRVPRVPCGRGRLVYGGRARDVALGRPVDIVRRCEFDADLVAQARARGIEILTGEGLASFEVEARADGGAGLVRIATTTGRRLTARVLVGADGAGSRVRRALAADARPPLRLFQAEVPMPPALAELVDGRMVYDFSPMARGLRGYVWLFPGARRPPERRRHALRPPPRALRRRDRGAVAQGLAAYGVELAGRRARVAGLASPGGRPRRARPTCSASGTPPASTR